MKTRSPFDHVSVEYKDYVYESVAGKGVHKIHWNDVHSRSDTFRCIFHGFLVLQIKTWTMWDVRVVMAIPAYPDVSPESGVNVNDVATEEKEEHTHTRFHSRSFPGGKEAEAKGCPPDELQKNRE